MAIFNVDSESAVLKKTTMDSKYSSFRDLKAENVFLTKKNVVKIGTVLF